MLSKKVRSGRSLRRPAKRPERYAYGDIKMTSKESANKVSEQIIQNERRTLRVKRFKTLKFRYGHLLEGKLLERYSQRPEIIHEAIKYSHTRWQVISLAFLWLAGVLALIYLPEKAINAGVLLIIIVAGGLVVARTARYYIRFYLESQKNNV